MKSKIIILVVVIFLIPVLVGAAPIKFAIKMGTGCPFDKGPKLDRCNPTAIHKKITPHYLAPVELPLAYLFSPKPSFSMGRVDDTNISFSSDALTIFSLRC